MTIRHAQFTSETSRSPCLHQIMTDVFGAPALFSHTFSFWFIANRQDLKAPIPKQPRRLTRRTDIFHPLIYLQAANYSHIKWLCGVRWLSLWAFFPLSLLLPFQRSLLLFHTHVFTSVCMLYSISELLAGPSSDRLQLIAKVIHLKKNLISYLVHPMTWFYFFLISCWIDISNNSIKTRHGTAVCVQWVMSSRLCNWYSWSIISDSAPALILASWWSPQ